MTYTTDATSRHTHIHTLACTVIYERIDSRMRTRNINRAFSRYCIGERRLALGWMNPTDVCELRCTPTTSIAFHRAYFSAGHWCPSGIPLHSCSLRKTQASSNRTRIRESIPSVFRSCYSTQTTGTRVRLIASFSPKRWSVGCVCVCAPLKL